MSDILLRNIPPEMKRRIEDLAHGHRRSLSSEVKLLLERALSQSQRTESSRETGGLGTRLKGLVASEDWTDDFIRPRDRSERPAPDFE
ncbi:FitA-like ribbon-helix-helix domain-containing protein [Methylocystis parvus]|uniref:Antitoxin FitA-like ribbon-helix-helix domain-containing protein n=1 Tax=Methylocystis parvus TaxID=134 RepID=A0A6B8MBX8_9HYPH|nr:hypothetical protein F7D14_18495 [Methylocystis parvus]